MLTSYLLLGSWGTSLHAFSVQRMHANAKRKQASISKKILVPSRKLPDNVRMLEHDIIKQLRVPPGQKIRLKDYDSGWKQTKELQLLGKDEVKARAKEYLDKAIAELAEAQELLYAENTYSILI